LPYREYTRSAYSRPAWVVPWYQQASFVADNSCRCRCMAFIAHCYIKHLFPLRQWQKRLSW